MAINLLDLPDEILVEIFSRIQNIRNKVLLLRVCKRFNHVFKVALRTQSYMIIKPEDYVYQREMEVRRCRRKPPFLPLDKLLDLAPMLTYFIDNLGLITTLEPSQMLRAESFNFKHLERLELILSPHGETKWIKRMDDYTTKLRMFLGNCPNLRSLKISMVTWPDDITPDWSGNWRIPLSTKLKSVAIEFIPIRKIVKIPQEFSLSFFGIIDGQAPELEFFSLSLYDSYDFRWNTPMLIEKLIKDSPKLRTMKVYDSDGFVREFNQSCWNWDAAIVDDTVDYFNNQEYKQHMNLEYISVLGIMMTESFWSWVLPKCPNLKFLAYDPKSDRDMITRVINKFCPKVIHNQMDHSKVDKEYEVYKKKSNLHLSPLSL